MSGEKKPQKRSVNLETTVSSWMEQRAPGLEEFEAMTLSAFASLPQRFRSMCDGVIIRVEDFPDEETMNELGAETEFDLLGLFQGVGLGQDAATPATGQHPNMVWLYRRPILDYWADHDETLGHIIRHVLIHEIGHHFGFSDADMEALESNA